LNLRNEIQDWTKTPGENSITLRRRTNLRYFNASEYIPPMFATCVSSQWGKYELMRLSIRSLLPPNSPRALPANLWACVSNYQQQSGLDETSMERLPHDRPAIPDVLVEGVGSDWPCCRHRGVTTITLTGSESSMSRGL
jgi:hypothetical protein